MLVATPPHVSSYPPTTIPSPDHHPFPRPPSLPPNHHPLPFPPTTTLSPFPSTTTPLPPNPPSPSPQPPLPPPQPPPLPFPTTPPLPPPHHPLPFPPTTTPSPQPPPPTNHHPLPPPPTNHHPLPPTTTPSPTPLLVLIQFPFLLQQRVPTRPPHSQPHSSFKPAPSCSLQMSAPVSFMETPSTPMNGVPQSLSHPYKQHVPMLSWTYLSLKSIDISLWTTSMGRRVMICYKIVSCSGRHSQCEIYQTRKCSSELDYYK